MLLDKIIEELEMAKKAAAMENASFGFPNDRIEIKSVHFGDDDRGRTGDLVHPDEYVKRITRLYRESWIIPPIEHVIEVLKLHKQAIQDAECIARALDDTDGLAQKIRMLSSRLK